MTGLGLFEGDALLKDLYSSLLQHWIVQYWQINLSDVSSQPVHSLAHSLVRRERTLAPSYWSSLHWVGILLIIIKRSLARVSLLHSYFSAFFIFYHLPKQLFLLAYLLFRRVFWPYISSWTVELIGFLYRQDRISFTSYLRLPIAIINRIFIPSNMT